MTVDYNSLKSSLEERHVKLIAVSKTQTLQAIKDIYDKGQRAFGENRVQEMVEKHDALPKDIEWHMIGYLQRNKVKYIAPFVSLIHSVDNIKLAQTIEKEAIKNERFIHILLQVKIAQEDSKSGFSINELFEQIEVIKALKHINVCGVMGMGTFTTSLSTTRKEFETLKQTFDKLKSGPFKNDINFKDISMGMSGDYSIAIEHGSTMVRIGSLLFGNRNY